MDFKLTYWIGCSVVLIDWSAGLTLEMLWSFNWTAGAYFCCT
ncbi:hypothetical protein ACFFF5_14805 [Lederbergia wuyishanensis]|uniref:Uncharacterized protein n=1 Tax=Lederbergia wuyishanensis TaxID=1347903 RepID=A0ABU0D397_9BACI|nr:hypothetical protein [Lederbergia wuyishanensis]MDQ0342879.1 hypothetical protein [Lederbergia wuyishanensis]